VGVWVLSQSLSAASSRVCQPSPVARKGATTSGDKRMVMRSLMGVFLGTTDTARQFGLQGLG
jgi:hypothetical protein